MNAHTRDWERWKTQWQRQTAEERTLRLSPSNRRRLASIPILESVVAATLLILVVLALKHAASRYEAALGLGVGVGICGVWLQRVLIRRREHAWDASASNEYLVSARDLAVRQARLTQFIWITLALELVFLIPWWVIGSRMHSRAITNVGSLLTMWLPIVGCVALIVWSVRSYRKARRLVQAIDRARPTDPEV
jgi:hypothetical protein